MQSPDNPDFITIESACAVVGGDKPISVPTFYRRYRHLIENPTPGTARVRRAKLIAELNSDEVRP